MDVVVCAGGDSTRRKADSAGEGGTMEIVPLDLYDSARAKIDANLRWLLAKAYGIDHIPEDLRDPFYTDQYDQEHIKPPIIRLLLSGELYCRVCGLILKGEQAASLKTHLSVIQALSRKGIYVQESDNTPVSDDDLSGAPVKMSSHIPLIDALMMAYTVEMISIERVVSSVKRFSTFSASKELPFDLEDAIVFWINKVNMKMREITEKELKMKQHLLESPSHPKPDLMHALAHCLLEPEEFSRVVRYRRDHLSGRTLQHFPLLDDLMKDVCDGTALLAVVHFYCPELMRLEDVCLKEVPSIADSLYNIQLLREFSNEYLDRGFYLRPEDLLYAPPVLKNNVMVFIAELFWWFEIVKPDFVQPRDLQDIKDVRSLLQPKSSRPHVPISNATKRSFLATAGSSDVMATSLSPDVCNNSKVSPAASPSHSLLPLRQRQQNATLQEDDSLGQMNRSSSMTRMDGQAQGSILAWPERRPRPLSQPVPYALHFPMEGEGDSVSLARSISKDSLASNVMSMTPKHMLGLPGVHLPTRRLNGQGLLGHIRIEDEEKEVEEEELVAIIHPATLARRHLESDMEQDDLEVPRVTSRVCGARSPLLSPHSPLPAPHSPLPALCPETQPDSFFLEPLMPAVLKPAKEKTVSLNKEEESGESRSRAGFRRVPEGLTTAQRRGPAPEHELNRTFTPIHSAELTSGALRPPTEGAVGSSQPALRPQVEPISREQSCGFFLHLSEPGDQTALTGQVRHSPYSTAWDVGRDSDSEIADLDLEEDEEEEEEQMELAKEVLRRLRGKCLVEGEEVGEGEGESDKLREDMKVCEREDKEGGSGRSSPCLSTVSWASSASGSTSVRMTSFAERKHQKISFPDGFSSASSSQKTTPDGSESAPYPLGGSWRLRREGSPCRLGKEGAVAGVGKEVVASELLQLHMQLEEQRRAIEHQKKKMETLSARQRLKLGKAAFLNIVKKGKSDTLPLPLKHHQEAPEQTANGGKALSCRDDSCLDVLRGQGKGTGGQGDRDNRTHSSAVQEEVGVEPEVGECSRSIELLNEAISSIQKQMMQLSLQQDRLMKQSIKSPPGAPSSGPPAPGMAQTSTPSSASSSASTPTPTPTLTPTPESRVRPAVHFVELATTTTTSATAAPTRRPPRLSSSRTPRTKPSDLKLTKENVRPVSSKSAIADPRPSLGRRSPKGWEQEGERRGESSAFTVFAESPRGIERGTLRSTTFRVGDEDNLRSSRDGPSSSLRDGPSNSPDQPPSQDPLPPCVDEPEGWDGSGLGGSSKEGEEASRGKGGHLIEVDLSDLNGTEEGGSDTPDTSADGEQKSGLGFFFKDEEKAEDEITKRRAAFLQKQLRKAEESRLRKLQQEADSELKRDEVRRKAEEDRVRKEEEKARRELIKQEYLRRKQEELMEEQGLVKPRPRSKPRKTRPKSLHRGESSTDTFSKRSTTPDLSCSRLGSTPSLAAETESVTSGGAESQRAGSLGSVESFPLLSRNSSRNMERDWENGSTASSITSTAEYHGPKLFKEPSSKSNKPIIHNAIAHCCLAGKVNETQKNNILEELERCESNHLLILFRDGGCQFRGIYSFHPDTEEIIKFIGTGPRSISRKMIDKLYKYSSDRKQFTHIPAKNVSVTVDALTIHNHLWQIKRPSGSKKK